MKRIIESGEKKIAIYSRKSKFTGKGESIENQVELCKQYISLHCSNVKDTDILIYEDEGFSGGNTDRPQFKTMMLDAKDKKISAIVCYRLDRISRNIGDFAKLIEELNDLNINFVSIKEQFDTTSSMGRAMMFICSVFSQLERETIAERIRDNMMELAKTGRWLGGTTPTGYSSEPVEKITVDGKKRKSFKLTIIPEESKLVQFIYKKFLETNSLTKTETYLIQNNYKSKNGKLFNRFTIKDILENPVYMIADDEAYKYFADMDIDLFSDQNEFDGKHGIMAYNKTLERHGKANKSRNVSEWIIAVGKHYGIISGVNWLKTQSCLEQNKAKSFHKPRSNTALLSGLLFCKNCGSYMRPKTSQRLNAEGKQIYSYLCEMKERSRCQKCNTKNPNGNNLDEAVCEEIKKLSAEDSEFMKQLKKSEQIILSDSQDYDDELTRLRNNFEENGKKISALVSTLAEIGEASVKSHIIAEINNLDGKNAAMKERIADLENLLKNRELSEIQFGVIRELISSFGKTFDQMTIEQKRAALRTFIEKVEWDGKNVHLYLFGAAGEEIDWTGVGGDKENDNSPINEHALKPLGENRK